MKVTNAFQLLAATALLNNVQCSVQADLRLDSQVSLAGCNVQNYAALGDSYSAGLYSQPHGELPICKERHPTPGCTPRNCSRNIGAYGYGFATEAPVVSNFQFLACSGANTTNCITDQVSHLSNTTDLVTFTIGGNNNNSFANVVRWCVYEHIYGNCSAALANATSALKSLDSAVLDLYQKVKAYAPAAKIVQLGYVQFWPADDKPKQCENDWLKSPNVTEKARMNSLVVQMNAQLADLAKNNSITFIDVDPAFDGHRLCDVGGANETWIRWALWEKNKTEWNYENGVFHPTWEGQDAYLAALKANLSCTATSGGEANDEL